MFNAPYIIYKCETCARETERQLDARRPDPIRCTITLNCRGKMAQIGKRAIKKFLFPSTSSSLIDYRPRKGAPTIAQARLEAKQISLTSASNGVGLTVAVVQHRVTDGNSVFFTYAADGTEIITEIRTNASRFPFPSSTCGSVVLYELRPELVKFKKYTYLIGTIVQSVRGADDSAERNNLRFLTTENVKVYVNGVELPPGEFDRSSMSDEIIFTPLLTSTNNLIEIIVFDDISVSITNANTVRLPLEWIPISKNNRGSFCWGDVGRLRLESIELSPLFCTDFSALIPGRSYGMVGIEIKSNTGDAKMIHASAAFILLGKQPFEFFDKDLYAYAKVSELINDRVFSYKNSSTTGAPELTVDESNVFQSFTPISITNYLQVTETTRTSAPEGTSILTRKYTLGPT